MDNPYIQLEQLYGAQNYAPLPVVLTRGEGVYVWDDQDKRYIDMMSAYSAVSHGHCHPRIVKVLCDQAHRLGIVSRAFYTDKLGVLLERACTLTHFQKGLAMNTGAEAVETALKAARKWAYQVKGVEDEHAEIIACAGNFHGRTISVISMSSIPQYKKGFGPFTPGSKVIPYGDTDALAKAITPNTAAFLVEPIQGEGGIIVPPEGYLRACYDICRKQNVLMICDEIQTGLGRTGKLLAYQYDDFQPDGLVLGKALGGGFVPISLFLTRDDVMSVFKPGDHGSTFGGNPLAAVIAKTALDVIVDEQLTERAAHLGTYFMARLKELNSPIIKEVRGKGLLIGVEVKPEYSAHQICLALLKHGVLTKETHETVIRFAPPLIITEAQIDEVISALKKVLATIAVIT
jgi:ornithine--oxo-acid transaminase